MNYFKNLLWLFFLVACSENQTPKIPAPIADSLVPVSEVSLVVLGTIQDAGSPQIGCEKECCRNLFSHPDHNRKVVSLGLIDPKNNKNYIFESTPDFVSQSRLLRNFSAKTHAETPDGIFVTHAHIGHYTGFMFLGKEAMNASRVPVYTMPRMKSFLEINGPWSQLVANNNIVLNEMEDGKVIQLTSSLQVKPMLVPHRDEYSETVGYEITGPNKKVLFIPDIDKWEKWGTSIIEAVAKVDYAFVDATFFDAVEINNPQDPQGRDISSIPHPFIIETMKLFSDLPASEKEKIYFIHFNHTNPVINKNSEAYKKVIESGFRIAEIKTVLTL